MNRRTYGILAGVIGSAIGAWWYSRRMRESASITSNAAERATVIFDNTPTATPLSNADSL